MVTQVYSGCEWFTTSSVNYVYDAFNNLVARTGYTRGAPPIVDIHYFSQFFVYDGANQVLALGADGSVANRYLWGPGVNQLLADDNYALGLSSPTLWTLGDNQNSNRDLVSSDGTLQQHIAYSPFGQQIVTAAGAFSTEAVCVFGYTGSFTDVVTGDVHNGVRWYDPASERWLTQDPAAADENLYRYCGNGPTDGTDPSGLAGTFFEVATSMFQEVGGRAAGVAGGAAAQQALAANAPPSDNVPITGVTPVYPSANVPITGVTPIASAPATPSDPYDECINDAKVSAIERLNRLDANYHLFYGAIQKEEADRNAEAEAKYGVHSVWAIAARELNSASSTKIRLCVELAYYISQQQAYQDYRDRVLCTKMKFHRPLDTPPNPPTLESLFEPVLP